MESFSGLLLERSFPPDVEAGTDLLIYRTKIVDALKTSEGANASYIVYCIRFEVRSRVPPLRCAPLSLILSLIIGL